MRRAAENYLKAQFPSRSVNEGLARGLLTAFLSQMDPTLEELSELRTALSEAVTNAVVHGYGGRDGVIYISLSRNAPRTVRISVKDHGCGIVDVEAAKKPLYTSDTTGERGGMGFSIMESFSDKLTVRSSVGHGTSVTMVRKLK